MMVEGIVFEHVSKKFADSIALNDVSFAINKGEFFSLLGPSGCGKTTLLRILAGFEKPDQGRILLDGQDITKLPANKRPINTVFQNYALFPHLTIWENIAFGLRIAQRSETEIKREVEQMLGLIQMKEHGHKKPDQISGGQKQRVAIARALVNHPRILLLDEPLAALDLKLRQKMLLDLDRIHDEVGITFIFVTHDQSEAMAVSDRIAVLHKGSLEQIGNPIEIYEMPKSSFVADFIGDTNFFDGWVKETTQKEYSLVDVEGFPQIYCFNDKQLSKGDAVHLSVRPEKIHISREQIQPHPLQNVFQGIVDDVIYKGDHTHFGIQVGDRKISVNQQHSRFLLDEAPIKWKDVVWIWWHSDDGFILERCQKLENNNE
ncbi:Spermidine/putrescine import ATP-binding protein PotA [Candidatus Protochlamydia amoebophila]|uniref:Spermidine/putrescine import ATP-binding protein PotA n=2 Tax=Candidatus Protochlamydia amoebophila TaxID=362787 RepID=A0A0C1JY84_9BACT|nr:Spermidine/putrescine import ATP-binding protein PotA [Candidatus Protochlamydia amoebophila]